MRILMLSKACIVGQYQSKLEAIARHPDVELTVVVPPSWRDERGEIPLERAFTKGYDLVVAPLAMNGHFHLHFYPTLPSILKRLHPDVVHIDEEPYNLATFLALRSARQVGAQSLFFSWQNIPRKYPPPFAWFESNVLRHSQWAIAGNRQVEQVLRGKGYQAPISIIPQFGLDPDVFTPGNAARQPEDPFRIGFVGRMVPEKGPDLLLRAIAELEGNWQLELTGSGPLLPRLKSRASELGIAERVKFGPWRVSSEMPELYRSLDVLVVPSISQPNWKEQFGRVLIEAMACGVPVIGTDCGEIPIVVGDAGLIIPENDVIALRNALGEIISAPERRAELGKLGRSRVLQHFTQQRVAEETYQVYCALMARTSSLHSTAIGI